MNPNLLGTPILPANYGPPPPAIVPLPTIPANMAAPIGIVGYPLPVQGAVAGPAANGNGNGEYSVPLPENFYDDPWPLNLTPPKFLEPLKETNRTEYEMQLDRAFFMRKNQIWPLFPFDSWEKFKLPEWYWDRLPEDRQPGRIHYIHGAPVLANSTQDLLLSILEQRYPCVFTIMDRYPGKVFPCGGFFTNPFTTHDVDLFFVNCTEKEGEQIMIEFESIFLERHFTHNRRTELNRTMGTTSFQMMERYDPRIAERTYQFIHRIYPSLAHVLGGFDLSCSMIGYDGVNIVANEMGAWAWVNRTIVIDISRRSLSFRHRLLKYHKRGFDVIFPGINHSQFKEDNKTSVSRLDEFNRELQALKEKFNVVLGSGLAARSADRCNGLDHFNDYYGYGKSLQGDDSRIYTEKERTSTLLDFQVKPKIKLIAPKNRNPEVLTYGLHKPNTTHDTSNEDKPADYDSTPHAFNGESISNMIAFHNGKPEYIRLVRGYKNDTYRALSNANIKAVNTSRVDRFLMRNKFIAYFKFPESVYDSIDKEQLITDTILAGEKILKVNWITQDPGRQWSSTVNPAIVYAQHFYKGKWNGLTVMGVYHTPIYVLLRLASLKCRDSPFFGMPRDIILYILNMLMWI